MERKYGTPKNCLKVLLAESTQKWKEKFEASKQDIDSKLETYYRINPNLSTTKYMTEDMLETDRTILARFRTG